jgi:hypothetical protein
VVAQRLLVNRLVEAADEEAVLLVGIH